MSHFFQYLVCPLLLCSPFGSSPLATIRFSVESLILSFSFTSSVLIIGLSM